MLPSAAAAPTAAASGTAAAGPLASASPPLSVPPPLMVGEALLRLPRLHALLSRKGPRLIETSVHRDSQCT